MTKSDEFEAFHENLRALVSQYLDDYVTKPALETVTKDLKGSDKVADLILMIRIVADNIRRHGVEYDKDFLSKLPLEEIEARIEAYSKFLESGGTADQRNDEVYSAAAKYLALDGSRKYLLGYLTRELNWIVISLLSASYVSALVLMRSVFELIVGIATRESGGMSNRIEAIPYLDGDEKGRVKKLWYRLCAWAHPYGKWIEDVCPIYSSYKPLYHPKLFVFCLDELTQLTDFFVTAAITKYEIEGTRLYSRFNEHNIDITDFRFLKRRLEA